MEKKQNFFVKAVIKSFFLTVSALLGVVVFCIYTESQIPDVLPFIFGGLCGSFLMEFIFYIIQGKKNNFAK